MEIFVESLKDDYIKVGKYRIRPFSILWWVVRGSQILGAWFAIWTTTVLFICMLG